MHEALRTLLLLPTLPLFYNFLQVRIVKSQKYDSVANSGRVPRHFKVSEAASNLGPMRKEPKTWGTLPELSTEPHLCIFTMLF